MTLDRDFPELDQWLQRGRRRLNLRFWAAETAAGTALGAGPALAAGLLFPRTGAGPALAVLLLVTGVWLTARRRRRLTARKAASELDRRFGANGLFRTAAELLEKEPRPPQGLEVLRQASDRARGLRLTMHWAADLLRTAGAAVLAAAALLAPGLTGPPASRTAAAAQEPGPPAVEAPGPVSGGPPAPAAVSPREAARRLFPEDRRLAALAEQALSSGDRAALDQLLEQNAAATPTGAEPRTSQPQESRPGGAAPGGGQGFGGPGSGSPGQKRPGTPETDPSGAEGPAQAPGSGEAPGHPNPSEGPSAGQQGPSGSDRAGAKGPGAGGQQGRPGGGSPGTGHSEQKLAPGKLPEASKKALTPLEAAPPGFFEFVLPGQAPRTPAASAVADARRSAEAALRRTDPPAEYQESIRRYFTTLAQEAAP